MTDLLNIEVRKKIINEILGEDNKRRKVESFRRLDIYKKNQKKYILDRIQKDLSPQTLANMRTFTSINFTQKICNSKASIYKECPERSFTNATEREQTQLENLYHYAKVDVALKKANRYYKLEDQAAVQVLPKNGSLHLRVLAPHHFDVIPHVDMPEKAEVYILSGFNKYDATKEAQLAEALEAKSQMTTATYHDQINQGIADREDYFDQLNYFVWWSEQYHFATNKRGEILNENNRPYLSTVPLEKIVNPIGKNPFVDLVTDRDFEYWAQTGSNVTDLQIDLGSQISDCVDVNFRQGYSQAILSATEAPKSMQIGPHTLLFLKKDPRADAGSQPSFNFATPSPDLASSIRLTEMLLAMGLTSEGLDANLISTSSASGNQKQYASGLDRMLAQLDAFSASQDDIDLFTSAEGEIFELLKLWNNALQNVRGPLELRQELKGGVISDGVSLNLQFKTPQMVQSQAEKEDSVIKKMESGLMSRKMAVMDLYGVDDMKAEEMIMEIDQEAQAKEQPAQDPEDMQAMQDSEDDSMASDMEVEEDTVVIEDPEVVNA